MPIPFGFFGSLVFLLALEAVLAVCFAFVWPGVQARPLTILGVGVALGAVASIALWLWFLSPLNGIGIAGQGSSDAAQSPDVLATYMQQRYALVVVVVAVAQVSVLAVLRLWLGTARA